MTAPADTDVAAAAAWASKVSRRRYASHRHELDALVVATVPSYERTVAEELVRFESAVASSAERYDAAGPLPEARPRRRLQLVLLWVIVLGAAGAFGSMVPIGGRAMGAAEFSSSDWQYLVIVSCALFVAGVVAQVLRGILQGPAVPAAGKDPAWLLTVLGVPTIAVMLWRVSQDIGVDVIWVIVTGAALAVSLVYSLLRLAERRRNPELVHRIDTRETERQRVLRDQLHELADEHGKRIAQAFAALPAADRDRLTRALGDAAAVLRDRGIIRRLVPGEAKRIARGGINLRAMVPGFLLLSRKVQEVWRPDNAMPGGRLPVRWLVIEFEPARRASRTKA